MDSLFSPRIGLRDLAQLCRRLAISLSSGIEIRRVMKREAENSRRPALRSRLRTISDAVARGDTLTEALDATEDYFPKLLREMVHVGEQTGHIAEVLKHLADHYEERLRQRRSFLAAITGPSIQLVLSLVVVSGFILLMGAISSATGQTVDIFGLGMTGMQGFVAFWMWIAMIAGIIYFIVHAARRGVHWTEPLQKFTLRVPALGGALQTIALGQMAWTMDLTLDAGMSLLKAMKLALDSTHNAHYTQHTEEILRSIRAGNEVHEALQMTGAFPFEFVAAVEVGENGGRLPEAMKSLAADYLDRARLAMQTITKMASWGVWAAIVIVIVAMIFRVFTHSVGQYYQTVRELAK